MIGSIKKLYCVEYTEIPKMFSFNIMEGDVVRMLHCNEDSEEMWAYVALTQKGQHIKMLSKVTVVYKVMFAAVRSEVTVVNKQ
jgi:hypothetical protein